MNGFKKLISQLWKSPSGRIGLILVALFFLVAIGAPILSPYDPIKQNLVLKSSPPSFSHLFGTDLFGRDILSRLLYGARISMGIGLGSAFLAVFLGSTVGLSAGFLRGRTEAILMQIVDLLLGFPKFFILLLVVGLGSPSIWLTASVLGALSWMEIARVVRGEVVLIREMNYVKAATALGLSPMKIALRYVLPNVSGSIIVSATLLIGTMILVEASLSYLGFGVQPPDASWGTIMNQGRIDPLGTWWISVSAGLAIILSLIGFNLLGDSLRDVLDPRSNNASS